MRSHGSGTSLLLLAIAGLSCAKSKPVTTGSGGNGGSAVTSTTSTTGSLNPAGASSASSASSSSSGTGGGGPMTPPAKLADYWAGHATWKLVRKYTLASTGWPYGYGAGAHITPVGHDWYLFGRKLRASAAPGCTLSPALTTQVRKSTDKGATWSSAVDLFANDPGSQWECAATDGDAFYDAQANLQLPAKNPFLYSSDLPENSGKPYPCEPAYSRLFRDPETGIVYLHTTHETADPKDAGIWLYQLTPSSNVLDNGDLWTCHTAPWTKFPAGPTNLVVYRHPNDSSDGNCYLATNCGATSCQPGQSIYEDIPIGALAGKGVKFGGKFATDSGNGALDMALLALDATGQILNSTTVHVAAPPVAYAPFEGMLTVDPGAVTLRYQLYLNTPETFRADEMYVEPTP